MVLIVAKQVGSASNVLFTGYPQFLDEGATNRFVSKFCVDWWYLCLLFFIILRFMTQNDKFVVESGVLNYYSKLLGKHVSKMENPQKNQQKKV